MLEITKMSIPERIQAYTQKHPTLDQSLLPEVYLTWENRSSKDNTCWYYATQTGELTNIAYEWLTQRYTGIYASYFNKVQRMGHNSVKKNNRLVISAGSYFNYLYFKYDPELEIMEMAVATFDTHRYNRKISQEENIRSWHINPNFAHIFYAKGSKTRYDESGDVWENYFPCEYRCWGRLESDYRFDFKDFFSKLHRNHMNIKCAEQLQMFAGNTLYHTYGKPIDLTIEGIYGAERYLTKVRKTKNKLSRKEKLIQELCAQIVDDDCEVELTERYCQSPDLHNKYIANNIYCYAKFIPSFNGAYKDWGAIRVFYCQAEETEDSYRMFFNHKTREVIHAQKFGKNDWGSSLDFSRNYHSYNTILLNENDILKNPLTRHFHEVMSAPEIRPALRVHALMELIKLPILEQLYKVFPEVAIATLCIAAPAKSMLNTFFGKVDFSKSLYSALGLTYKQFQIYQQTLNKNKKEYTFQAPRLLKQALYADEVDKVYHSLSDIPPHEFKCALKLIQAGKTHYMTLSIPDCAADTIAKKVKLLNNMYQIYMDYRDPRSLSLFHDCLHSYRCLTTETRKRFKMSKVKTYDELANIHDALALAVMQEKHLADAEKQAKLNVELTLNNKKRLQKHENLEYEDNSFLIRLPKSCAEIRNEGVQLHHCVTGYIDSHVYGHTTLLFLRNKAEPDKPFYTIELTNQGIIKQIHGMCNCWLGNDPTAVLTVMRWLKLNKFECSKHILTSTATGYSDRGAGHIELPQLSEA